MHALGGPTAILEIGGLRILTDPTFDAPREYVMAPDRILAKTAPTALRPGEVGPVDAVLLSHDQHKDNLDEAGRAYLVEAALVLTTASATERLAGPCVTVPLWEHVDLPRPDGGSLRVTRVPALHGPEGSEHIVGEVAGFVLSGEGLPTVYVSGDNAALRLVQEVADRLGPIDVALLFAGAARTPLVDGFLTLTSVEVVEAAKILVGAHIVPLHLDSWRHFTEGGDDLRAAFAEAGMSERMTLLTPGEKTFVKV